MDKVSYALGIGIGRQLASMGAESLNIDDFAQAVKDAIAGKLQLDEQEAQELVQNFFAEQEAKAQAAAAEKGKVAKEAGEKFLAENGKKDGVITTKSGLQYQILREGNGKAPKATDQVECHYEGTMEYRYWTCERFSGHFWGIHIIGTQYNIAGHHLPLLFGDNSSHYRYEGWGAGGGISYGYHFLLSNRWSLEANIGAGYVRLHYDKFRCKTCGEKVGTENRNYFGPTKAAISLIFLIK